MNFFSFKLPAENEEDLTGKFFTQGNGKVRIVDHGRRIVGRHSENTVPQGKAWHAISRLKIGKQMMLSLLSKDQIGKASDEHISKLFNTGAAAENK